MPEIRIGNSAKSQLSYIPSDDPVPQSRTPRRSAIWTLLDSLVVGQCVEINRRPQQVYNAVSHRKRNHGSLKKFTVRKSARAGHSKVWRIR